MIYLWIIDWKYWTRRSNRRPFSFFWRNGPPRARRQTQRNSPYSQQREWGMPQSNWWASICPARLGCSSSRASSTGWSSSSSNLSHCSALGARASANSSGARTRTFQWFYYIIKSMLFLVFVFCYIIQLTPVRLLWCKGCSFSRQSTPGTRGKSFSRSEVNICPSV